MWTETRSGQKTQHETAAVIRMSGGMRPGSHWGKISPHKQFRSHVFHFPLHYCRVEQETPALGQARGQGEPEPGAGLLPSVGSGPDQSFGCKVLLLYPVTPYSCRQLTNKNQ